MGTNRSEAVYENWRAAMRYRMYLPSPRIVQGICYTESESPFTLDSSEDCDRCQT